MNNDIVGFVACLAAAAWQVHGEPSLWSGVWATVFLLLGLMFYAGSSPALAEKRKEFDKQQKQGRRD